jgi:hypothetical protein
MLNRAEEIYTLPKLSGHPGAQLPLPAFADLYSRSPEARQHLGDRIGEWMLRPRKDEVISLPDKVRTALLSTYPSNCARSTTKFSLTTA